MNDCDNIWSVGNKVSLLILLSQSSYMNFNEHILSFITCNFALSSNKNVINKFGPEMLFVNFRVANFESSDASRDILTK